MTFPSGKRDIKLSAIAGKGECPRLTSEWLFDIWPNLAPTLDDRIIWIDARAGIGAAIDITRAEHDLGETLETAAFTGRFGAEVRQVVVQSGQTAEVRFQLVQRAGGSSPLGEAARAVNEGVGTVQRFIQGLGL